VLERFRKAKAAEVFALQELVARGVLPRPREGSRPSFRAGLESSPYPAVIAEYKRSSPSKGDIGLTLGPEAVAWAYAKAGAAALSVLTEEVYFKGKMEYLERMAAPGLPLLRKDFIIHPLQIAQTAASPACALLLVARMLDEKELGRLLRCSQEAGLEPVTEVFDADDLRKARAAGAAIIQVNNRDLSRLTVDFSFSRRLITRKKPGEFWITASGIEKREELDSLLALGFDAALIGSSLMSGGDPGGSLAALLKGGGSA
jgi:indole-3-glycerol phosphate synthase